MTQQWQNWRLIGVHHLIDVITGTLGKFFYLRLIFTNHSNYAKANKASKTSSMTMLFGPNSERHKPHLESGSSQGLVSPAVLQRELGLLQLKVDLLELVHVVSETEVTEIR